MREHRQGEQQAEGEGGAGSPLSKDPDLGLDSRTSGSWTELRQMLHQLNHPGVPKMQIFPPVSHLSLSFLMVIFFNIEILDFQELDYSFFFSLIVRTLVTIRKGFLPPWYKSLMRPSGTFMAPCLTFNLWSIGINLSVWCEVWVYLSPAGHLGEDPLRNVTLSWQCTIPGLMMTKAS